MRAKILKNLLILIGLFIIGCILAGAIRIAYVRYQTSHQADGLLTGAHPDAEEDYDKYLKETDSDIDGMTMYEKYKKEWIRKTVLIQTWMALLIRKKLRYMVQIH